MLSNSPTIWPIAGRAPSTGACRTPVSAGPSALARHDLEQHRPVSLPAAAADRLDEAVARHFRPRGADPAGARQLEGVAEVLERILGAKRVGRKIPRQQRLHA